MSRLNPAMKFGKRHRPVFSATFDVPLERTAPMAASELLKEGKLLL